MDGAGDIYVRTTYQARANAISSLHTAEAHIRPCGAGRHPGNGTGWRSMAQADLYIDGNNISQIEKIPNQNAL